MHSSLVLLDRTSHLVTATINHQLYRKHHLSIMKFTILEYLVEHEGKDVVMSDFARLTYRERHNITTLMKRLERQGYVGAKEHPTDKRARKPFITEEGKKAYEAAVPVINSATENVFSSLSVLELERMDRLLEKLRTKTEPQITTLHIKGRNNGYSD